MRRSHGSMQDLGVISGSTHRWKLQVSDGYQSNGKRRRVTRHFEGSRRAAEAELSRMLSDTGKSVPVALDAFFDGAYMDHCKTKGLRENTIAGYRNYWDNHVRGRLGRKMVGEVEPSDVSALLSSLSAGAAKHLKAVLSSVYAYAEECGTVEVSVMRRKYTMPMEKSRKADETVMDYAQLCEVAELCRGERWEWAFLVMAFGGLRRSEAAGLQPDDIEEVGGYAVVSVRRAVVMVDNSPHVQEPKTADSRRFAVVAPPHAQRLLEIALERRETGSRWMCGDVLWSPNSMSASWDNWFSRQPVVRIPMRNLRNSYGTWMAAAGHDVAMVGKLMGHTQMGTTFRHYLRPTPVDAVAYLRGAKSDGFQVPTGAN